MNKLCFRVVFNRHRGVLMAVQETAASDTRSSSGSRPSRTETRSSRPSFKGFALSPVFKASALACALALGTGAPASAQTSPPTVQASPAAPAGQRPIVDAAANGVPLVHIAPPTAAGISRNGYQRLDVDTRGLILNNSARHVQTQLGGWVGGNPQLGYVPARVIVNEVLGPDPSSLKGAIEVAGQRADVVISNPNGLSCDGCSFIDTGRATLSTGSPQYDARGALTGFDVRRGSITVGSQGLDVRALEQLDLFARGLILQGQLHAHGQLQILAEEESFSQSSYPKSTRTPSGLANALADGITLGAGLPLMEAAPLRTRAHADGQQTCSQTTSAGSSISAGSLKTHSGKDTTVQGSLVLADGALQMKADGAMKVLAQEERTTSSTQAHSQRSGFVGSAAQPATGTVKAASDSQESSTRLAGSCIVSLQGDVTLDAAGQYTQTASEVRAFKGNADIGAGEETSQGREHQEMSRTALGGAVQVAASRSDHPHHKVARRWLEEALHQAPTTAPSTLQPMVLASFLRLVTHPKIFENPNPITEAVRFADAQSSMSGVEVTQLGEEWPVLCKLCADKALAAKDLPDAWLAVAVIQQGEHLVAFDRVSGAC